VKIELDAHIRQCDHCSVKNLKRTFHIQLEDDDGRELDLYIGRVCIGRMLAVDTSGNPHKALERLIRKVNKVGEENAIDFIQSEMKI